MATYHLNVTVVDREEGVKVYKKVKSEMPIDHAKELAAILGSGGFLKEHKGVIATGDDSSFTYYPPHRVVQIDIEPDPVLKALS
jgi:hypothetical protein